MTDTKLGKDGKRQLVIVTGLSGAGKSAALHAFEDIGFQAIDNLPLTMVSRLVSDAVTDTEEGSIAIGIDSRTMHFSPEDFVRTIKQLRTREDVYLHVLFMDASDEVLMKRFSETRRPHPLGEGQLLRAAIKQEREMMVVVRDHIDGILDTSARTGAETRRIIRRRFTGDNQPKLIVTFMSFGFSNGVPRDADLVLDVRFLRNPHYVEELRPFTGRDKKVSNYVRADEGFAPFLNKVEDLFDFLLPRYKDEGKSYLTIAFGCTGGRHRSVATAEALAARATGDNMAVNLYHRELIGDEKR
ncbi:RNase adapter RapZ [Kordiimonas laminariae]|uniref:RNase adapter RapZ n=1 Tax=Kordiimonas laminariae TaxID=2917717 RepID=UPI001FF6CE41|nr:RNase adapter RapZ [Kordiimonas laminariae]